MGRPPPIKNTGGEGFGVEDAVVAWLACHMLTDVPWPNASAGLVRSLQCQMRQDGWHFDDVVVQVANGVETLSIGCSIKSFPVFGPRGAPAEFVDAIWRQWHSTESPFCRGRDRLAVIAAEHKHQISETWRGLLDEARAMAPETLAHRLDEGTAPSASRRLAFESIRCPASIDPTSHASAEETARLLASLSLQEQDFSHGDSRSTSHAIALCQQALTDSERARAPELWDALVTFSSEVRRKGGIIDLPRLIGRLASRFPLKQHPSFAPEWERIRVRSAERMSVVSTTIGGTVALHRGDLLHAITKASRSARCATILGGSGYGKTVLAHAWATLDPAATAIWIRSSDLLSSGGLRALWSLQHTVAELFRHAATPLRVVLDGLDRCFNDEAFAEAALVLKAVSQEELQDRVQVAITCRPDDWDRVRSHLSRHGCLPDWQAVEAGELGRTELTEVARQLPAMSALITRPHLQPLLRWPKALDIVATHWAGDASSPQWATESDFARWFWRSAITRDERLSIRGRTLRKLATVLADRLVATAAVNDFSSDELAALRELQQERHVEVDDERETVRFTHDLVADFARLQELLAQGGNFVSYIRSRLHSPFWHRAVRLYGLNLLECGSDSGEWERCFRQFSERTPTDEMAQNLLLEAPVFALYQRAVLDRLWQVLAANEGDLLGRFLRQFLRVATVPNEKILRLFSDNPPDVRLRASLQHRWPFVPYWFGVLAFLDGHCAQAVGLTRGEIADVCLLWLPLAKMASAGVKEAAHIAVTSARQVYRSGKRRHHRPHRVSPEEKACEALLGAAPVMPEEVSELALKMSGRQLPDPADGLPDEPPEYFSSLIPAPGPPRPWPEGPRTAPVPAFCRAFMTSSAAEAFLDALPDVAAEVMFAVLLNIPREGASPNEAIDLDEHGFSRGEIPREALFWTSGPFLRFLRLHPEVALPAIVRLVNFGTESGLELRQDYRTPIEIPLTIDATPTVWRGHQFSYLWHRGHVFGPWAVCCALLSVERWLYLLMDAGEPIEEHLETILRQSRSIAMGAVLVSVGKRKPELFLNVLRPVLAGADFYILEEIAQNPMNAGGNWSPMWTDPAHLHKAWSDWMQMPHRKEILGHVVVRMLIENPESRAVMEAIRKEWQERLDAATEEDPAPGWLPRLIVQFDPANYRARKHESGTVITFEPPPTLPQPTEEDLEQLHRLETLTLLPFECLQVLMGERTSTEEQMQAWWDRLKEIRSMSVPDGERGVRHVEDALCGIVAVAVVRHRQWLAGDPDRERQASEILAGVGGAPPRPFWFVPDDVCEHKWDNFAAWAITTLWREKPTDPYLRAAVAGLSIWNRYRVVERVLRIAAAHRAELGHHFEQLLAHTIRFAQARHIARVEEHVTDKSIDFDRWKKQHVARFRKGRTELLPDDWAKLREAIPGRFLFGGMSNSLDFGHVNASLAWAEDLDQAQSEEERRRLFGLHRQALLSAVHRMEAWRQQGDKANGAKVGDSQRKWPYRDEEELLRRIARITARLKPGEPHSLLWEPVFALGADAPHWIQCFVSRWLLEAAGHERPASALIEQWLAMLDFAERSGAWKKATDDSRYIGDCWEHLFGLSPVDPDFWHAGLAPAVAAIRPHFERWAMTRIQNPFSVRPIIYFLKTKAAAALRMDGLEWLRQRAPLEDQYYWQEESTQEAFAGFLQLLYDENWSEVSTLPSAREAFMSFALKLAALQHPLGSELLVLAGNRLGAPS